MKQSLFSIISVSAVIIAVLFLLLPSSVHAAQLNDAFVRLDRMKASTTTGGTVCLKMATAGSTDAKVKVTFPSAFTLDTTAGNWTVTTTNLPTDGIAMPGIATATLVASKTVTFPISNIANNTTLYCFNFSGTSTLTTGTAASNLTGTIEVTDSGDTVIDSAAFATAVISDDQISVTATVPATFSLALNSNSQALGTLSSSAAVSGTGVLVSIGTNAGGGWIGWLKSANAGLTSAATVHTIPTKGTVNATVDTLVGAGEGYVVDADLTTDSGTSGTGVVSIDDEYNGTTTNEGGSVATTFSQFASATGPTDGDEITLTPRARIIALTPAATDYTDTLTIVAAGNF